MSITEHTKYHNSQIPTRGVSNGSSQFESARKIWPALLELLEKIR